MANDIGGPNGEGGALSDDNETTPPFNRINDRQQFDYTPSPTLDQDELPVVALDSDEEIETPIRPYLVESVGDDLLICRLYKDGETSGKSVLVAKPAELQRTPFDGNTLDGILYTYASESERQTKDVGTTSDPGTRLLEDFIVSPAYFPGTTIIYAAGVESTELTGVTLVDINADGRTWRKLNDIRQYRVKSVAGDYVTGVLVIDGAESGSAVNIAKPFKLRRTPFDGNTVNGITYVYASDIKRNADNGPDDEDQVIVPAFLTDFDLIYAAFCQDGTDVTVGTDADGEPVRVMLIDMNVDGRAWAKEFV